MFKFDLFGARPNVFVHGKQRASSYCGLALTWISGSVLIIIAIFFSKELVLRQNPTVIPARINTGAFGETFYFKADDFIIAVTDLVNNFTWVDETIYTVQAYQFDLEKRYRPIKMVKCSATTHIYRGHVWCVDPDPENIALLNARSLTDRCIQFLLLPCNNDTSPVVCQSPEVIKVKLSKSWFGYILKDAIVDVHNYSTPIKRGDHIVGLPMLPYQVTKSVTVIMKKIIMETDYGVFFEDKKVETSVGVDATTRDLGPMELNFGAFATLFVYNGGNLESYYRSYIKLQDVMANISGFMSTLLLVFGLIAYRYARFRMFEKISHDSFNVTGSSAKAQTVKRLLRHRIQEKKSRKTRLHKNTKETAMGQDSAIGIVSSPMSENYHSKRGGEDSSIDAPLSLRFFESDCRDISLSYMNDPDAPMTNNEMQSRAKEKAGENFTSHFACQMGEASILFPDSQQNIFGPKLDGLKMQKIQTDPANSYQIDTEENQILEDKSQDAVQVKIEIQTLQTSQENTKRVIINETGSLQRASINVNWWEWALSFFKDINKVRVVEDSNRKVKDYLDVSRMLRMFIQFERLVDILLDKEQKMLFDNLPPPQLNSTLNISFQDQAKFLDLGVQSLLDRENMTCIDEKLLELYENSL